MMYKPTRQSLEQDQVGRTTADFPRGLVFIRGTGRCGTKSLVNQLGRHPNVRQVPVNEVLPEELLDWAECRIRPLGRQGLPDGAIVAVCRGAFAGFCRSLTTPGGMIIQKSTMRAHRLGDLLTYWPEARLIYLVRHPVPTVESLINSNIHLFKGGQGFKATVANSLLRWYNDLLAYLRSAAFGDPRVLQVRFEDFVADPPGVMDRLHGFIGVRCIPYEPASRIEQYERRFVLDERERRWILDSTRAVCDRLGYGPSENLSTVPDKCKGLLSDYPDRRLRAVPPSLDGVELVKLALSEAACRGYTRVGLFGAGYMARLTCPHLSDLPVEVAGLLDENPMLAGQRQDGFTVHSLDAAADLGIQAVIPLTMTHQELLIRRWQRMFGSRIPVVPLWDETGKPVELCRMRQFTAPLPSGIDRESSPRPNDQQRSSAARGSAESRDRWTAAREEQSRLRAPKHRREPSAPIGPGGDARGTTEASRVTGL
ncbi:MAG: sulfotransferase [Planctomycetes bacterium]|nr:sulfotransferase [Planctomycetota bacterium]